MPPIRMVAHHGGNVIGRFPSLKSKRMISFESRIELDALYVLDYERDVERIVEQPLKIAYRCNGGTLHYTPDFHVLWSGRNILIECKPEKFLDQEENRRKFAAASRWCAERSWEFCVMTDRELRAGPRLANIKLPPSSVTHDSRNCIEKSRPAGKCRRRRANRSA